MPALLPFAYNNVALEADLLNALDEEHPVWVSAEGLQFLGRTRPNSDRFWKSCRRALLDTATFGALENAVIAARQLAEHHGHRSELARQVVDWFDRGSVDEGLILALAEAWPESPEFDHLFELVKREEELRISSMAVMNLTLAKSSSQLVLERTRALIGSDDYWSHRLSRLLKRPIARRFQRDDSLCRLTLTLLASEASPSEKVTLARFVHDTASDPAQSLQWVKAEIHRQEILEVPEVGFDLFQDRVVSVSHSLLDIIA